jgi:TetR/AcrR family transcriptional regulator, cholesterol catabolism regulator
MSDSGSDWPAQVMGTLTKSQAERRARVIRAALELASHGGYDAVQMRDVATQANVALGTIYRYFSSKDALLASAMVEWMAELEGRVQARPPSGSTTAERVMDVLDRALRAMQREPELSRAVVTALTAGDPAGVEALTGMRETLARIMRPAFPADVDPALEASVSRVVGHVWWSAMIAWANGMGNMAWVTKELAEAVDLLAKPFDDPRS